MSALVDLITKSVDSLIDDYWDSKITTKSETVYHYTNPAGLFGIIEAKSVFASERRFLNDSTESELDIKLL